MGGGVGEAAGEALIEVWNTGGGVRTVTILGEDRRQPCVYIVRRQVCGVQRRCRRRHRRRLFLLATGTPHDNWHRDSVYERKQNTGRKKRNVFQLYCFFPLHLVQS